MKRSALVFLFLLASCAEHRTVLAPATTTPASTSPTSTMATATPSPVPTRTATPFATAAATDRPVAVPGAGGATQAIVVRTPSWNATSGTLTAYEKAAGHWRVVVPATTAFVGRNGFASDKREGDGRTPAGAYGFSFMFGTARDPGVHYTYRRARSTDVWVDDPASSLYNTWQREPSNGRWASAERLYQPGAYRYAAVIAYNTKRTPGRGSAIFLHVSLGHATAGCVAVDEATVVRLLAWLDPHAQPVIVMGPRSYVDRL